MVQEKTEALLSPAPQTVQRMIVLPALTEMVAALIVILLILLRLLLPALQL
jgi:hypothetical protein